MNKKILAIGMLAVFASAGLIRGADATAIVSVDTGTPTVSVGTSMVVNVDITAVSDLYGFQFDLGFNPTVLSVGVSNEGTLLPGGGATFFVPGTNDNVGGSVTATADTLLTAISGVTGTGTLASFDFTAIGAGISALTLSNLFFLDSSLTPIVDYTTSGGLVTVNQATSIPEPSTLGLLGLGLIGIVFSRRNRAA
jgi:hypothetical protein